MTSISKKIKSSKNIDTNILIKFSNSHIISRGKRGAYDAIIISKKLLGSTDKAAWIADTTFLILGVPLIEMDQKKQFNYLELQQARLLGVTCKHTSSDVI